MKQIEPSDIDLHDPAIKTRYAVHLASPPCQGGKNVDEVGLKEFIATLENARLKNEAYTAAHPAVQGDSTRITALEKEVAALKTLLQEALKQ